MGIALFIFILFITDKRGEIGQWLAHAGGRPEPFGLEKKVVIGKYKTDQTERMKLIPDHFSFS